jgi:hypothetical protein
MPTSIADLMAQLDVDPWRAEVGFSADLSAAHASLVDTSANDADLERVLAEWLAHNQPCLFGRIAAARGHLGYCFLRGEDLRSTDEHIQGKIQDARLAWLRAGRAAQKSGFIVLALSDRIARATPGEVTRGIAQRLCSLYLLRDIAPDEIFHDEIFLERSGPSPATWQWFAGVNYFCAQGDKRWWQDHRIPGGMAFSVNSVGHMVKSAIINQGMSRLDADLGLPTDNWDSTKIDSPNHALVKAMLTIDGASNAPSGNATWLLKMPTDSDDKPMARCPFNLPARLADMDFQAYAGHYHTDVTVPSEYFLPEVERPSHLTPHILDFTYLYERCIDNPDFITMGEGRRIQRDDPGPLDQPSLTVKERRMVPTQVAVTGEIDP